MKILRIVSNQRSNTVVVLTVEHGRTVLKGASIFDFSTEAKLITAVDAKVKEIEAAKAERKKKFDEAKAAKAE